MGIFDNDTESIASPWSPLVPGVMQGVDFMRSLLTRGPYAGPYAAGIDPRQLEAISAGAGASGGAGGVAGAYTGAGNMLLPGIGSAFDYYGRAMGGGMNPWMTNREDYLGLAGDVANNPYVDSMVTASLRDPFRALTEETLPGIGLDANLRGMAGGSQEAIERGIAMRGFNDRAADVSAGIRGNLYNTGLGFANQAANSDYLLAQNAADNMFRMGSSGLDFLDQGYEFGQRGATDMFNWGTRNQGLNNDQITAQMAQWNAPWELGRSYGSYMNPLAGNLRRESTEGPGALAALLGPVLGNIGEGLGEDAWDWIRDWDIWGDLGIGNNGSWQDDIGDLIGIPGLGN